MFSVCTLPKFGRRVMCFFFCAVLAGGLMLLATPTMAKLIDIDSSNFGARDFVVNQDGYLEGTILNISGKPMRGLRVTVTALDRNEQIMWEEMLKIPFIGVDGRHRVLQFLGPEAGSTQPASYNLHYKMDDRIGRDPSEKVISKKKQIGFTVKGTGDFRTRFFAFEPGEKKISLEYLGNDEIIVLLLNKNMTFEERLFDVDGPVNATNTIDLKAADEYTFHFTATAPWQIHVADPMLEKKRQGGSQAQNKTDGEGTAQNGTAVESPQPEERAPPRRPARRQQLILE